MSPTYAAIAASGRFTIYGNPDLKPETNDSAELGLAWRNDMADVSVTLFRNEVGNLVTSYCVSNCGIRGRETRTYTNVNEARLEGVETAFGLRPVEGLSLTASYTYVDSLHKATDRPIAERPQRTGKIGVDFQATSRLSVGVRGRFIGEQLTSTYVRLPGYSLWGTDVSYDLSDHVTLRAGGIICSRRVWPKSRTSIALLSRGGWCLWACRGVSDHGSRLAGGPVFVGYGLWSGGAGYAPPKVRIVATSFVLPAKFETLKAWAAEEGPRRGERYDAYKLNALDGKGKWWEGLDPKSFYGDPVMALPDGFDTITAANAWHELNDRVWDEKPPLNSPAFTRQWYLRCKDLIDSYKPDMVYFDNFDLPLGQVGLDITAHYYNASAQWNNGKVEAVVNIKPHGPFNGGVVADVERGSKSEIDERPWQTCTCIGQWHYNRRLYTEKKYLPAADVVHRLCDIVSKNGNLLLSVPVRADGSIDSEERRIVEEIAGWMARFGEAIYGTRPWRVFGEGPTQVGTGMFGERDQKSFTHQDIRFTTKDKALYAISLGRPAGYVTITSLDDREQRRVKRIEVVGHRDPLTFRQSAAGLVVDVPTSASHDFGLALKIFGVI